jgi:hypothetical protein
MVQTILAYLLAAAAGLWSIRRTIRAVALRLRPARARAAKPGACKDCSCGQ